MTQPTILVTGATGNTGGAVVSELLHRGVPVRAMVRTRDARSAALRARGAEVVVADIFDPDQLVAAMRGGQRACVAKRCRPGQVCPRRRSPRYRPPSAPSGTAAGCLPPVRSAVRAAAR